MQCINMVKIISLIISIGYLTVVGLIPASSALAEGDGWERQYERDQARASARDRGNCNGLQIRSATTAASVLHIPGCSTTATVDQSGQTSTLIHPQTGTVVFGPAARILANRIAGDAAPQKADYYGPQGGRNVYPIVDSTRKVIGTATYTKGLLLTPLHVVANLSKGERLFIYDADAGSRYAVESVYAYQLRSDRSNRIALQDDLAVLSIGAEPSLDGKSLTGITGEGKYISLSYPEEFGAGAADPNILSGNIVQDRSEENMLILEHKGQNSASSGGAVFAVGSTTPGGIEVCIANNLVKAHNLGRLNDTVRRIIEPGNRIPIQDLHKYNVVFPYAESCEPIRSGASGSGGRKRDGRDGGG